jgi:hypothetical protein
VTWRGKHVDKTINLPKVKNSFLPKGREAEKTGGELFQLLGSCRLFWGAVATIGELLNIFMICKKCWGAAAPFDEL